MVSRLVFGQKEENAGFDQEKSSWGIPMGESPWGPLKGSAWGDPQGRSTGGITGVSPGDPNGGTPPDQEILVTRLSARRFRLDLLRSASFSKHERSNVISGPFTNVKLQICIAGSPGGALGGIP
jgi:hypothetical protein